MVKCHRQLQKVSSHVPSFPMINKRWEQHTFKWENNNKKNINSTIYRKKRESKKQFQIISM